jgi:hypothetical protein
MNCSYVAVCRSLVGSVQLAEVEEPTLPLLVELEWLLNQEDRRQNTILNTQHPLLACHVRLHVPRATHRHLDLLLLHQRIRSQSLMVEVYRQLGHPVAPLGPPLLHIVSLPHRLHELLQQSLDLLLGKSSIFPALFEFLAGDPSKGHPACS